MPTGGESILQVNFQTVLALQAGGIATYVVPLVPEYTA